MHSSSISTPRRSVKKSLTFGASEPLIGNWDPYAHSDLSNIIAEGFTHNLLFGPPQSGGDPEALTPELALRQRLIDPYTLVYELRQGVKFHDGNEFNAEDVRVTFEYATRESAVRRLGPGLVETEIIDSHTILIKTEKYGYPASYWWFIVTLMPIISASDVAYPSKLSERPNGTGPFIFTRSRGGKSHFKANEDYFEGRPKLDEIVYRYIPELTTRELSLWSGEADIIERLEPQQIPRFMNDHHFKVVRTPGIENKFLFFRCSKPPFDDWRLRLAACMAIDRNVILERMGEAALPTFCHVAPPIFGATPVKLPEYNPSGCQQLLSDLGYPRGKGLPELEYIVSEGHYPRTKEYGQVISQMLNLQGFKVNFKSMDMETFLENLWTRPNGAPGHLIDCGWAPGSPEPDLTLRWLFHSKISRISEIRDPEIDEALDREGSEPDLDSRKKRLKDETLLLLAKKVPALPLFNSVNIHAMKRNLRDLGLLSDGRLLLRKAYFD